MLHFFARLSIRIAVVVCLIVGVVCLIDSTIPQQMSDTLRQFDCTPKPCWHGIHIGVATAQDAASILDADQQISLVSYYPAETTVCWQWNNGSRDLFSRDGCYSPSEEWVLWLLPKDSNLRLGDTLPIMGKPITSYLCSDGGGGYIYSQSMIVWVKVPANATTIDPEAIVDEISYVSVNGTTFDENARPWQGFSAWANSTNECPGLANWQI